MKRWRFPSLSIHGIEGAYSDPGSKTVIPRRVTGKFSIRIVPNQDPQKIEQCVTQHLNNMWKLRQSANKLKVFVLLLFIIIYCYGIKSHAFMYAT